jgi:hypothetical protein
MSKIAVFYHIFQFSNWEELLIHQIQRLERTGLLESTNHIHLGINGTSPLPIKLNISHSIHYNSPENFDGEMETMSDLYKFCVENMDYRVLFFHTKGISSSFNYPECTDNVISWREYLEKFNIDNWKRCIELLETHDCVGTEWETDMLLGGKQFIAPCYAGTFWWANASYISKLDPSLLFVDAWGEKSRRFQCEFWIGSGNPNYYNFYSSNTNKYSCKMIPEEYEKFL